jgi:hypothetical protein
VVKGKMAMERPRGRGFIGVFRWIFSAVVLCLVIVMAFPAMPSEKGEGPGRLPNVWEVCIIGGAVALAALIIPGGWRRKLIIGAAVSVVYMVIYSMSPELSRWLHGV